MSHYFDDYCEDLPCVPCENKGRTGIVYDAMYLGQPCKLCQVEDMKSGDHKLCKYDLMCTREAMADGGCFDHPPPCKLCQQPNHWVAPLCEKCQ